VNRHQRISGQVGKEEETFSVSSSSAQPIPEAARRSTSVRPGSTGPWTLAGKGRSRCNALKHGIFAKAFLLEGESAEGYELLLNGLRKDLQPHGTLEDTLVEMVAISTWRYRRLIKAEAREETQRQIAPAEREDVDLRLRYKASILRSFERALNLLERYQRIRSGQSLPPTVRLELPG
jgi:hypothetical protein